MFHVRLRLNLFTIHVYSEHLSKSTCGNSYELNNVWRAYERKTSMPAYASTSPFAR